MGSLTNSGRRTPLLVPRGLRRRLLNVFIFITVAYFFWELLGLILGGSSRRPSIWSVRKFKGKNLRGCFGRIDDETPISARHIYSPNGLLHVEPNGIHPILELIKKADAEWENKVDKASRTLGEAVAEYNRRYKRDPPAGFDAWWDFAQQMESQLPDEYDTIHRELEPFWGIDPKDLADIQAVQETKPDSFTLAKNQTHDTNLVVTAFSDPETREQRALLRGLEEIISLLDSVEPDLPPFRAVFSPHETPTLLSDYHVKKAYLDAAAMNKYVNLSTIPTPRKLGFASACAPGSPARLTENPLDRSRLPPPRPEKTFIYNHRLSMDPCQHPHLFHHHTQYVSHDTEPIPESHIAAQFSYSTTPLYNNIQPPSFLGYNPSSAASTSSPESDTPWENKTDERLIWRGTNIGMRYDDETRWRQSQRPALISWAKNLNGSVNLLIPGSLEDEGWQRVGWGTKVRKALINPAMFDLAFSGEPLGCNVQYCRYLDTQFEWRNSPRVTDSTQTRNHKYILDIDEKGWSKQFKQLMMSNSLVFKATAYPEWWLDRSQPWVHYVPIQTDYSDLHDSYVFFHGGLYGEGSHDHLAKKIAYAGKEWITNFWREEDMTVYFFRLLLEYARVMSPSRTSMSYTPK